MSALTSADQAAAVLSFMNQATDENKRGRDDGAADDAAGGMRPSKMSRTTTTENDNSSGTNSTGTNSTSTTTTAVVPRRPVIRELLPAPWFHYRNHSMAVDDDPLTPLTPPGRVPNFPAKMHAILSREDFADIVSWLPHGRSWRVLKPREFEIKVIPMFFEHAKFSSFVRQANGWGFRRITQGKDRNSYYHEKFLRGLPHISKTMKRPGVNEKKTADPEHEPDLYKISEMHPLPEKADDESIMLHCTVQGGPKARMPIYCGPTLSSNHNNTTFNFGVAAPAASVVATPNAAPSDNNQTTAWLQSSSFQQPQPPVVVATPAAEQQQHLISAPGSPMNISPAATAPKATVAMNYGMQLLSLPTTTTMSTPARATPPAPPSINTGSNAAPTAFGVPHGNPFAPMAFQMPAGMNAAAASQFAAGFAAATAFSQQHFSNVLNNLAKQQRQQQQPQFM